MSEFNKTEKQIDIDLVFDMTSKMRCIDSVNKEVDNEEKNSLERKLNSMFGQWFEGD